MELPLPKPTPTGSRGRANIQLQSIMYPSTCTNSVTPKVEQDWSMQLPPIQSYVDYETTSSSEMSRQSSIVSAFSTSDHSIYPLSRSNSPTTIILEPSYDRSPPVNRLGMHDGHLRRCPYPTPNRCSVCLLRNETIHVEPGKSCARCHEVASESKIAGKAARRKRDDRVKYSEHSKNSVKPERISKEQGEAGRRFDHNVGHANMQAVMLSINSDLPRVAKQGGGEKKPGWTLLKSNNRSEDVKRDLGIEPLAYNKLNMYDSICQVTEDGTHLVNRTVGLLDAQENKAKALLHAGGPMSEEMRAFLSGIAYGGHASQLATASSQRGSVHFSVPF